MQPLDVFPQVAALDKCPGTEGTLVQVAHRHTGASTDRPEVQVHQVDREGLEANVPSPLRLGNINFLR